MHRGYVKLWRKTLDSTIWQNPNLCRFWIYCLMKATHKPTKQMVGYREVELNPGQFVFGRNKAKKETGLSDQSIRTSLLTLKKLGNLTSNPTNKYTVLTIEKWEDYQAGGGEVTSKVTNKQPTTNQQLTTNKNDKNTKNKNLPPYSPPTAVDVASYCSERGNHVDAEQFVDFYTAKGWMVGKSKMKDWKACVRTWEKRTQHGGSQNQTEKNMNVAQRWATKGRSND